uniref:ATP synthase complex subunit 8 n=1 Tax=Astropecten polyacanthus TaxID=60560 RepID=Q5KSQ2_ASTPO|nr:ATP synthase F0 subunit 8 [Astropecten polyacanthus]BAD86701.1 ATPase subunit 8 [Astropecten polyacanthus]
MPQLNFAWWLLNFLLGWAFILVVFMVLSSKNLNYYTNNALSTNTNQLTTNNWLWN